MLPARHVSFYVLLCLGLAALSPFVLSRDPPGWIAILPPGDNGDKAHAGIMSAFQEKGVASIQESTEEFRIGKTFRSLAIPRSDPEMLKKLRGIEGVQVVKQITYTPQGVEENAPIGLDRIDSRTDTDGKFTFPDGPLGTGVVIYTVDTGIDPKHPDIKGRVTSKDFTGEGKGEGRTGHGTHVAGILVGKTYGIAKDAEIRSMRALGSNNEGYTSDILKALQAISNEVKDGKLKAVVNMSLGGPISEDATAEAENQAIKSLVADGVPVVVASGNQGNNSCNYSPAFIKEVVTVGAINEAGKMASYSNYGNCVDILAPGSGIESAKAGAQNGVVKNGTSMSSPHVAGVVAVYMSRGLNGSEAVEKVLQTATTDVVGGDLNGTPDKVLYLDPKLGEKVTLHDTAATSSGMPSILQPAMPFMVYAVTSLAILVI